MRLPNSPQLNGYGDPSNSRRAKQAAPTFTCRVSRRRPREGLSHTLFLRAARHRHGECVSLGLSRVDHALHLRRCLYSRPCFSGHTTYNGPSSPDEVYIEKPPKRRAARCIASARRETVERCGRRPVEASLELGERVALAAHLHRAALKGLLDRVREPLRVLCEQLRGLYRAGCRWREGGGVCQLIACR